MKKLFVLLTVIIVILLGVIGYMKFTDYKTGDVEDREELLLAVTNDLFNNKNISFAEIEDVTVYRQEAGVYPFFYLAVVHLGDGTIYRYKWENKEKSELEIQQDI